MKPCASDARYHRKHVKRHMRRLRPAGEESLASFYDRRGVLGQIERDGRVNFSLDEELRSHILRGRRRRRLQNISVKLDPVQMAAVIEPEPVIVAVTGVRPSRQR